MNAAKVSIYSLENSRVCIQNLHESNFHIFYVLLQQMPNDMKERFFLDTLPTFAYLNGDGQSSTLISESFTSLDTALWIIGYSSQSKDLLYRWIAAILHLGEIRFEESQQDICDVSKYSKVSVNHAAELLNINADELKEAMLLHHMNSIKETWVLALQFNQI